MRDPVRPIPPLGPPGWPEPGAIATANGSHAFSGRGICRCDRTQAVNFVKVAVRFSRGGLHGMVGCFDAPTHGPSAATLLALWAAGRPNAVEPHVVC